MLRLISGEGAIRESIHHIFSSKQASPPLSQGLHAILVWPKEMIQPIASHSTGNERIALTSASKDLFNRGFQGTNASQHLQLKNAAHIQDFLNLISNTTTDPAIRQPNDFQAIKQLTLTVSNSLTKDDIHALINALPNLSTLNIELDNTEYTQLQTLLTESQILSNLTELSLSGKTYKDRELPPELWQKSRLQTLRLIDLPIRELPEIKGLAGGGIADIRVDEL